MSKFEIGDKVTADGFYGELEVVDVCAPLLKVKLYDGVTMYWGQDNFRKCATQENCFEADDALEEAQQRANRLADECGRLLDENKALKLELFEIKRRYVR